MCLRVHINKNFRKMRRYLNLFVKVTFVITFIFFVELLQAQVSNKLIKSFSVKNEQISEAITLLSVQSGLNFSYDALDKALNKRITYKANNKTISQILNDILNKTNRTFKQIDNQIVIYKPIISSVEKKIPTLNYSPVLQNPQTHKAVHHIENKHALKKKPLFHIDTLLVIDTIVLHDTIIKFDTLKLVDTIFIKQEKSTAHKIKEFPVNYFQQKNNRENGWAASIYYAPMLTKFSFTEEENQLSLRSFTIGTNAAILKKLWDFSFGFQFSQFANRFQYSQTNTTGGFYLADTLDIYYTISGADTNWFFVTDSIWQPIKNYNSHYEGINRLGYFELNLSVSYTFFSNKKIRAFGTFGSQLSIPLYQKGIAIVSDKNQTITNLSNLPFGSPLFSILVGGGIRFRLNEGFDFISELHYVNYFQPMTQTFQTKNIPNAFVLKIGLIYYFH